MINTMNGSMDAQAGTEKQRKCTPLHQAFTHSLIHKHVNYTNTHTWVDGWMDHHSLMASRDLLHLERHLSGVSASMTPGRELTTH
mmetsp:Transcript_23462/g.67427  ORF Transcript_23462/g.67427 Transcript_23462/m.67427 type:complete len:85 (-) Transcript_23462:618-872(-)